MKKRCFVYYVIFLLTLMDIAFTAIGLKLGLIVEANPVIRYIINLSMGLSMLGVLLIVGVILTFIYKVSYMIPWIRTILVGLAGVKVYVLMLHISWFSYYMRNGDSKLDTLFQNCMRT